MSSGEEPETTAEVVKEIKKQSSDVNILKEYKDLFSKEKSSGSDKNDDKIADESESLAALKSLIEQKKSSIKDDEKRQIWEFRASPHEEFGKSLDDTYGAFLKWARLKQDHSKVNVSKALRRLESYAEWMDSASSDLTEPPLSSSSIKSCLDVWGMNSSIDSEGKFVWWIDLGNIDTQKVKNEYTPEDHLRAFVWYCHAILYDKNVQENGIICVENCGKIGIRECFTLMPAKLGAKLDRLTIGVLPIKMSALYMLECPFWISVFMKLMGMFMSKKMKERFVILQDWSELDRVGGVSAIPKRFGKGKVDGELETDVIEDLYFP